VGRRTVGGAVDPQLDALFGALADTTRRRLLARLAAGPARVTDLARPFAMSLPAVSKHLKVLEQARLVSRTVNGRVHRLAIRPAALRHVETWLDPFRAYWEENLVALRNDLRDHPAGAGVPPRRAGLRGRGTRPLPRAKPTSGGRNGNAAGNGSRGSTRAER